MRLDRVVYNVQYLKLSYRYELGILFSHRNSIARVLVVRDSSCHNASVSGLGAAALVAMVLMDASVAVWSVEPNAPVANECPVVSE